MTPNPDTNPEEFDMLAVGTILLQGDLRNFTPGCESASWGETCNPGEQVRESQHAKYFRRKTKQKEPMKYYRQLEIGEKCLEGDVFLSKDEIVRRNQGVGESVASGWQPTFRPVEVDEWVSVEDGLPSVTDVEPLYMQVDVTRVDGGATGVYYANVQKSVHSHWRRITPPAPEEKPININENGVKRAVVLTPRGATVGCVNVDALTMDRIVEKWQKVKSGEKS